MAATIVIRDPHIRRRVASVMKQRKQKTLSRTAQDLILERLVTLEKTQPAPPAKAAAAAPGERP
jgi:hypothetical protein